uniref:Uncharacterized protein n=1 Tax=Arundo donax TaxID=35708 RepID=A0A0A9FQS0_ARUDO
MSLSFIVHQLSVKRCLIDIFAATWGYMSFRCKARFRA